jgi:septal ring factor EnvC (AmiA/AmiB activator)
LDVKAARDALFALDMWQNQVLSGLAQLGPLLKIVEEAEQRVAEYEAKIGRLQGIATAQEAILASRKTQEESVLALKEEIATLEAKRDAVKKEIEGVRSRLSQPI